MQELMKDRCPKCGGDRAVVIISVPLTDGVMLVQPNRRSNWSEKKNRTELEAVACVQCGYTEFYAREPGKLAPDS